mgnify:CR=1 FL=1
MKILIAAVALALGACAHMPEGDYGARIQVWAARDLGKKAVGENPIGNVLVSQPLPWYASLYFQHISSMAGKDPGEVNQVGVGFCFKEIGRAHV